LTNSNEMNEILKKHKIWIFSCGKNGEKADLKDINLTSTDLPVSIFIILGEKYFISICGDYVRAGCSKPRLRNVLSSSSISAS